MFLLFFSLKRQLLHSFHKVRSVFSRAKLISSGSKMYTATAVLGIVTLASDVL